MAGAGKKTFVAGEVLTAAQVNDYLMDQAVMRFSGSAARAASITAPTEGMVTYLDDANALEVYDGSAWITVDLRRLVTASAQVLVGAASGSVIAVGGGAEGQVLTAASAQPGGVSWVTPSGAGAAVYFSISSSAETALPATLTAGFYRISSTTGASFNTTEWLFLDGDGNKYGATINAGAGFYTLPVDAASIQLTKGTPLNVLIEEIPGVTSTLIQPPSITTAEWTDTLYATNVAFSGTGIGASVGVFNVASGSLQTYSSAASVTNTILDSDLAFGASPQIFLVALDSNGVWSTASPRTITDFTTANPWAIYRAPATFTPPDWATTASVLVVAGGGGGAGISSGGNKGSGAGGAGGAVTASLTLSGSVAVTVGAGGAGGTGAANGTTGNPSSFGVTASAAGGGYGGRDTQPGGTGGSGGGAGSAFPSGIAGAAGIAGQGNNGGPSVNVYGGGGGGKGGVGGTGTYGVSPGGAAATIFGTLVAGGGSSITDASSRPAATGLGYGGDSIGADSVTTARNGGAGADGAVIVRVYE